MSGLLAALQPVTEISVSTQNRPVHQPHLVEPLPGSHHSLREVAPVAPFAYFLERQGALCDCDLPLGPRGIEPQDNPVSHVLTKYPWRGTKMNLPYLEFGLAIS